MTRRGLLGAADATEDEVARIRVAYDVGDLGQLLASCPSVDGLVEVIARSPTPRSEAGSDETREAWSEFAALANTIRNRRNDQ